MISSLILYQKNSSNLFLRSMDADAQNGWKEEQQRKEKKIKGKIWKTYVHGVPMDMKDNFDLY